MFYRLLPEQWFPGGRTGKNFALAAVCFSVVLIAGFGIFMPRISETLRTEKPFFARVKSFAESGKIPPERIFFFHHGYTNPSFYLKRPEKITVLDPEDEAKAAEVGKELQHELAKSQGRPLMVIGQLRYFRGIREPALRRQVLEHLKWTEPSGFWENPKKNGKKYAVFMYPP